jgi:hypothetical protein
MLNNKVSIDNGIADFFIPSQIKQKLFLSPVYTTVPVPLFRFLDYLFSSKNQKSGTVPKIERSVNGALIKADFQSPHEAPRCENSQTFCECFAARRDSSKF